MSLFKREPIYCSVDLEFTGFDPLRDQILEIGFAFFKMTDQGAVITEQWSQVFKPTIEVHPKILGLTGITLEELEMAPDFSEHRDFLQKKLGDCIIVGHNPTMDVKFLEGNGIRLSGKTIDTLELVQFLLPTHHSYNLENLMHFFGIAHENAHRALGDAISTISVLENLLRIYQSFGKDLQSEILKICKRGEFLWQPLLQVIIPSKELPAIDSLNNQPDISGLEPFVLGDELVSIDGRIRNSETRTALGLKEREGKTVFVVEDGNTVMHLWKAGIVHGVFAPEDVFNNEAFNAFLSRAQTPEELRFCLKLVVWKAVNWQTDTVNDLNISFFGGQFRQFIIGGELSVSEDKLICCDYKTFHHYSQEGMFNDRHAVISNLQAFEKFISTGNGSHVSWSSVLYGLRSIYNPESDFGNNALKDDVVSALAGADLFFALVYMLLHREYPQHKHVSLVEIESRHNYIYGKIAKAALNLTSKLSQLKEKQNSRDLARTVAFFEKLFGDGSVANAEGRIRWVTLDEQNTSFHDQPLDVSGIASETLGGSRSIKFTETITEPTLLLYLTERLGLNHQSSDTQDNPASTNIVQLTEHEVGLESEALAQDLLEGDLPAVVVVPDVVDVKNFYNSHYQKLKERSAVFAQSYSGGGNKMFRNFNIKQNSILLATFEFIAKQKYTLAPKRVIFAGQPDIDITHPYVEALSKHWAPKFPDFAGLLEANRKIEVLKKLSGNEKMKIETYQSITWPKK